MTTPEVYRHFTSFSLLHVFDITLVDENATEELLTETCRAAIGKPNAYSVSVLPAHVKFIKQILPKILPEVAKLQVCAGLNYPAGKRTVDEVCMEATSALNDGADEFECLIDWARMNENVQDGGNRIRLIVSEVKKIVQPRKLKVILEVGKLSGGDIISKAAVAALEGGADFLQTSAGTSPDIATFFGVHLLSNSLNDWEKRETAKIAVEAASQRGQRVRTVGIKIDVGPNGKELHAADFLMQMVFERGMDFIAPGTFRLGGTNFLLKDIRKVCSCYVPPDTRP